MSQAQVQPPRPVVVPEAKAEIRPVPAPVVKTGWATFAGVLFAVVGIWNVIAGWAALVRKEYFSEASLLYHDLQVTAWVWLGIGVLQVLTSYLIFTRRRSGMWLGVVFAGLSMLAWFFSIGAYPLWAIMIVAIDALVIYGLLAHSEVFE